MMKKKIVLYCKNAVLLFVFHQMHQPCIHKEEYVLVQKVFSQLFITVCIAHQGQNIAVRC